MRTSNIREFWIVMWTVRIATKYRNGRKCTEPKTGKMCRVIIFDRLWWRRTQRRKKTVIKLPIEVRNYFPYSISVSRSPLDWCLFWYYHTVVVVDNGVSAISWSEMCVSVAECRRWTENTVKHHWMLKINSDKSRKSTVNKNRMNGRKNRAWKQTAAPSLAEQQPVIL